MFTTYTTSFQLNHERHNLVFFVKSIPLGSNGKIRNDDLNWMFEREAFIYSEIMLKFNGDDCNVD